MKRRTGSQECFIEQAYMRASRPIRGHTDRHRLVDWYISPLTIRCHSRHDESLLPGLSQHPVHEQRHVGEAVLVPLATFIKAQPENANRRCTRKAPTLTPPPTVSTGQWDQQNFSFWPQTQKGEHVSIADGFLTRIWPSSSLTTDLCACVWLTQDSKLPLRQLFPVWEMASLS